MKLKRKSLKAQLGIKCEPEIAHDYKKLREQFCKKWGIKDQIDNAFIRKLLEDHKKCEGIE